MIRPASCPRTDFPGNEWLRGQSGKTRRQANGAIVASEQQFAALTDKKDTGSPIDGHQSLRQETKPSSTVALSRSVCREKKGKSSERLNRFGRNHDDSTA